MNGIREVEISTTMFSEAQVTKIAKALSDRIRLRTYLEIARRRQICAGQLGVCNMVSKATVSHHLRVLAEAGLVSSSRNGQYVVYRANREVLLNYCRYLRTLANPKSIHEEILGSVVR